MSDEKTFANWYDNGTGFFDGDKLIKAATIDEAILKAGKYAYPQVLTESWSDDPNISPEKIIARH